MKKAFYVESYDEVLYLMKKMLDEVSSQIERFSDSFCKNNIQLSAKPCFFYNGKFATTCRKKGACVFIRVQLSPTGYSYSQAEKNHFSKKFFSHRIIEFNKTKKGYYVKLYSTEDSALKQFLTKLLKKGDLFKQKGKPPELVLKENLWDVCRSFIFIDRYRSELKTTFYGFDIHWILLILALILIIVNVHVHYEFLFN